MLSDEKPTAKFLKFIRSEEFRNLILAITCILGIYNLGYSRFQNRELNDMQYIIKATEMRPTLRPLQKPKILSVLPRISPQNDYETAGIYLSNLKTKLILKNTGNDVASIVALASVDAYNGDSLIRDKALGKKVLPETYFIMDTDFWAEKQIQPGETIELDFSSEVGDMRGDSFIRHYWVLYKNSAGMLFDAYYWNRFTATDISCTVKDEKSQDFWFMISSSRSHKQCFAINVKEDTHSANYVYNPAETKVVNRFIDKGKKANECGFGVFYSLDAPFGKLPCPDNNLN